MNTIKNIITHSWKFHPDEVFASAIIKRIFSNVNIIRTRDINLINEWKNKSDTILLDIWQEYDTSRDLYDHHQQSFDFEFFDIKNEELSELSLINFRYFLYSRIFFNAFNAFFWFTFIDNDKNKLCQLFRKTLKTSDNYNLSVNTYVRDLLYNDLQLMEVDFISYKNCLNTESLVLNNIVSFELNNFYAIVKNEFFKYLNYRKYATAWLIWHSYGDKFIINVLGNHKFSDNNDIIFQIKNIIDRKIVKYIDNWDNGIFYGVSYWNEYDLSNIISSYNAVDISDNEIQLINFNKSINLVIDILHNEILKEVSFLETVKTFQEEYIPWLKVQHFSKFIPKIEKLLFNENDSDTLFYIYPYKDEVWNIKYRINTVSTGQWFENRIPLPDYWLYVDVEWLLFCHKWLFIAEFNNLYNLNEAIKKAINN